MFQYPDFIFTHNKADLKKNVLILLFLVPGLNAFAQVAFSVSTDLSLLRNFTPNQKFLTLGQTVMANWHLKEKETIYTSISYYVDGRYKNALTALAKDTSTSPQQVRYTSSSRLRYRTFSVGWKHYFTGTYNREGKGINVYGLAGLGLISGRVENSFTPAIDTALYQVPQKAVEGSGGFKRLSLDLGAGLETELFPGIYVYGDARTWIPASEFPSPYLYNNDLPKVLIIGLGLRIALY